ncbi:hypothetical protein TRFO_18903 [Tritrichomonas foetus]|uniref:Uncharacterized protein n=1 Tax=Tritrichomonas foetus TaxID=1144522 RepID=A0A1J4KJT0_9EUKA|nr:hypothetical protein TRFO_18903 [Tritrichomonas foetus]|eukprot:OHT11553.1 hypothetical protein TRFO_18903 [Tritrichomonas foetus]
MNGERSFKAKKTQQKDESSSESSSSSSSSQTESEKNGILKVSSFKEENNENKISFDKTSKKKHSNKQKTHKHHHKRKKKDKDKLNKHKRKKQSQYSSKDIEASISHNIDNLFIGEVASAHIGTLQSAFYGFPPNEIKERGTFHLSRTEIAINGVENIKDRLNSYVGDLLDISLSSAIKNIERQNEIQKLNTLNDEEIENKNIKNDEIENADDDKNKIDNNDNGSQDLDKSNEKLSFLDSLKLKVESVSPKFAALFSKPKIIDSPDASNPLFRTKARSNSLILERNETDIFDDGVSAKSDDESLRPKQNTLFSDDVFEEKEEQPVTKVDLTDKDANIIDRTATVILIEEEEEEENYSESEKNILVEEKEILIEIHLDKNEEELLVEIEEEEELGEEITEKIMMEDVSEEEEVIDNLKDRFATIESLDDLTYSSSSDNSIEQLDVSESTQSCQKYPMVLSESDSMPYVEDIIQQNSAFLSQKSHHIDINNSNKSNKLSEVESDALKSDELLNSSTDSLEMISLSDNIPISSIYERNSGEGETLEENENKRSTKFTSSSGKEQEDENAAKNQNRMSSWQSGSHSNSVENDSIRENNELYSEYSTESSDDEKEKEKTDNNAKTSSDNSFETDDEFVNNNLNHQNFVKTPIKNISISLSSSSSDDEAKNKENDKNDDNVDKKPGFEENSSIHDAFAEEEKNYFEEESISIEEIQNLTDIENENFPDEKNSNENQNKLNQNQNSKNKSKSSFEISEETEYETEEEESEEEDEIPDLTKNKNDELQNLSKSYKSSSVIILSSSSSSSESLDKIPTRKQTKVGFSQEVENYNTTTNGKSNKNSESSNRNDNIDNKNSTNTVNPPQILKDPINEKIDQEIIENSIASEIDNFIFDTSENNINNNIKDNIKDNSIKNEGQSLNSPKLLNTMSPRSIEAADESMASASSSFSVKNFIWMDLMDSEPNRKLNSAYQRSKSTNSILQKGDTLEFDEKGNVQEQTTATMESTPPDSPKFQQKLQNQFNQNQPQLSHLPNTDLKSGNLEKPQISPKKRFDWSHYAFTFEAPIKPYSSEQSTPTKEFDDTFRNRHAATSERPIRRMSSSSAQHLRPYRTLRVRKNQKRLELNLDDSDEYSSEDENQNNKTKPKINSKINSKVNLKTPQNSSLHSKQYKIQYDYYDYDEEEDIYSYKKGSLSNFTPIPGKQKLSRKRRHSSSNVSNHASSKKHSPMKENIENEPRRKKRRSNSSPKTQSDNESAKSQHATKSSKSAKVSPPKEEMNTNLRSAPLRRRGQASSVSGDSKIINDLKVNSSFITPKGVKYSTAKPIKTPLRRSRSAQKKVTPKSSILSDDEANNEPKRRSPKRPPPKISNFDVDQLEYEELMKNKLDSNKPNKEKPSKSPKNKSSETEKENEPKLNPRNKSQIKPIDEKKENQKESNKQKNSSKRSRSSSASSKASPNSKNGNKSETKPTKEQNEVKTSKVSKSSQETKDHSSSSPRKIKSRNESIDSVKKVPETVSSRRKPSPGNKSDSGNIRRRVPVSIPHQRTFDSDSAATRPRRIPRRTVSADDFYDDNDDDFIPANKQHENRRVRHHALPHRSSSLNRRRTRSSHGSNSDRDIDDSDFSDGFSSSSIVAPLTPTGFSRRRLSPFKRDFQHFNYAPEQGRTAGGGKSLNVIVVVDKDAQLTPQLIRSLNEIGLTQSDNLEYENRPQIRSKRTKQMNMMFDSDASSSKKPIRHKNYPLHKNNSKAKYQLDEYESDSDNENENKKLNRKTGKGRRQESVKPSNQRRPRLTSIGVEATPQALLRESKQESLKNNESNSKRFITRETIREKDDEKNGNQQAPNLISSLHADSEALPSRVRRIASVKIEPIARRHAGRGIEKNENVVTKYLSGQLDNALRQCFSGPQSPSSEHTRRDRSGFNFEKLFEEAEKNQARKNQQRKNRQENHH